ncbi:hypothetical protein [Virgibacillus necropolis]
MNRHYDHQHIYDLCKKHMHAYVLAETSDGKKHDGIITGLDDEYVYIAVPNDQPNHKPSRDEERQFGYGYPGYGYGYGYGRPRRFNRLILPLAALTALSILPWY